MDCEEAIETTQALVTRIAMTLQQENNALTFLGEGTTSTLIMCMQTVSRRHMRTKPTDPGLLQLLDGQNPDHRQFIAGHRHTLRRLLVKACRDSGALPSSLFLGSVRCDNFRSVAGGCFSDVYRAEHSGEPVALKRLRIFEAGTDCNSRFKVRIVASKNMIIIR